MGDNFLAELAAGCERDVEITAAAAEILLKDFSANELLIVDMTTRMTTEPRLVIDSESLLAVAEGERARKFSAQEALGVTKKQLGQKPVVVGLFNAEGIEVPTPSQQ